MNPGQDIGTIQKALQHNVSEGTQNIVNIICHLHRQLITPLKQNLDALKMKCSYGSSSDLVQFGPLPWRG
jgi:hypothetical protein